MNKLIENKTALVSIVVVVVVFILGGGGLFIFVSSNLKTSPSIIDLNSSDSNNIGSSTTTHPISATNNFLVVEIMGAVKAPGVYTLEKGSRIADLIVKSGGYSENVFVEWINRNLNSAQVLQDGTKIYIPFSWDLKETNLALKEPVDIVYEYIPPIETANTPDVSDSYTANNNSLVEGNSNLLDINSCTKDQLLDLSGIGEVYASKILANRPYSSLDDLISKSKIPSSTAKNIQSFIKF